MLLGGWISISRGVNGGRRRAGTILRTVVALAVRCAVLMCGTEFAVRHMLCHTTIWAWAVGGTEVGDAATRSEPHKR
eukprot:1057453-Rhodomonas_salina.2